MRDKFGRFMKGHDLGCKRGFMSKEIKKKISLTKKRLFAEGKLKMWSDGKKLSKETKLKISKRVKEVMNTLEMKEKLSKVNSHPAWNKGIPCREETKKKLNFINRRYKQTNEAIEKIRVG